MSIEGFKGQFADLARPNRFKVQLGRLGGQLEFLCKGTNAPADTVEQMDVNYQGRIVKLPGDRTYQDWTITVYGSIDYSIYRALKAWSEEINQPEANVSAIPEAIKEDASVFQLDRSDATIAQWRLVGAFPTEIGQIEFDWGTNSTPLEFTATFAFDYVQPF